MATPITTTVHDPHLSGSGTKEIVPVTVLNNRSDRKKVIVVPNPDNPNGRGKLYGSDTKRRNNAIRLSLRSVSGSRAARTANFEFDRGTGIRRMYVKVYEDLREDPEPGTSHPNIREQDIGEEIEGGSICKNLSHLRIAMNQHRARSYYAANVSFAYPRGMNGPQGEVKMAITKIVGLPRELTLVQTFPKLKQAVSVDYGDTNSEAVIVMRQNRRLSGTRYTVEVHKRILSPAKYKNWPTQIGVFEIVNAESRKAKRNTAKRTTKRKTAVKRKTSTRKATRRTTKRTTKRKIRSRRG